MSYIDIILIIVVFISFAIGWKLRGIFVIILPVAFFLGLLCANLGHQAMAGAMVNSIPNETKRLFISYTLVFLASSSILVFAGMTLARFFDFFKIAFLDRALGAVIMISIMLIPTYFLITLAANTINPGALDVFSAMRESFFFPAVENYVFFLVKIPVLENLSVIDKILE